MTARLPRSRSRRLAALATSILLVSSLVPAALAALPQEQTWVGDNGEPVSFADEAALLEYLRNADIVDNDKIAVGVTGPRRLVLEQNGVRVKAVFRAVDETHSRVRLPDGSFYQRLRDFSGYEVAAYEIAKMLDMDTVPPAVSRRVRSDDGTIQIWVEGTMMESERVEKGLRSPDPLSWRKQMQEVLVFDDLIGNIDRNAGNLLIDANWKVWLIDHTRAFQQGSDIKNAARIMYVRQSLFERMKELNADTIRERAGNNLDAKAVNEMMERRDKLVAHIQALVDERGAEAVLWQ